MGLPSAGLVAWQAALAAGLGPANPAASAACRATSRRSGSPTHPTLRNAAIAPQFMRTEIESRFPAQKVALDFSWATAIVAERASDAEPSTSSKIATIMA